MSDPRDGDDGEIDRVATVPDPRDELSQVVAGVLSDRYPDPIYTVEDGTVWVSGMNAHAAQIARKLAKELVHSENIPCSLIRDDNAVAFPGVEFDYYDPELLDTSEPSVIDRGDGLVTDGGQDADGLEREECAECEGPVDPTEPGHYKSADDETFVHSVCFEEGEPSKVLDLLDEYPFKRQMGRQYGCGHYAHGPPADLPDECPECEVPAP